ncbi:Ovochymase-1 [Apis cerana cerana]|uniref:Ovochymase-1 n=1 Tax=Apis cerana cerana TaxID=94128 RepID=A0A2A3EC61_APICC|nr:Ovochymase-1 [Apis cerana cerana]
MIYPKYVGITWKSKFHLAIFGSYTNLSNIAHRNFEQQGSIILQNSEQQVTFKPSEQQKVIFQPEEQDEIFQSSEKEKTLLFENIQQNYEREEIDKNYFLSDGAKFAKQQNDFTISCIGPNRICINKNNCVNGFYAKNISYSSFTKIQQCRVYDQVCCTIKKELERGFETSGRNVKNKSTNISLQTGQLSTNLSQNEPNPIGSSIQNIFVIPTHAQIGCAAALLCVEEQFCTIDGTISSEPVTLSEKEILRRVPTSSCQNPDNGIIGKCCRDPNYTDPWPTGNLPANYSGGFDEQGFPTFLNIAKAKLSNSSQSKTSKTIVKYYPMEQRSKKVEQKFEPTLVPENSDIFTKTLIPPIVGQNEKNAFNAVQRKIKCGIRNKIRQESEIEDSKTIFAEIPWQAMVLHSKERKILCSGVLIGIQEVLTAANCVDSIHPGYNKQGHGGYDLATLHLNSSIIFDLHINPLCLPDSKYLSRNDRPCISTGWGKSILQAHYAGAIMRAVDMDILSKERCKEQSLRTNLEVNDVDGIICVTPKKEINNVCETDIGSPLACQNENGFYELAGIYSRDTGCLPTNQIAVFAPLDVSWLKRVTFSSNESPSEKRKTNSTHDEESSSKDYRKSTLSTDNQYLPPNRK